MSVAITVFSAGLSVSGLDTQFVYSVQPLSEPPQSEGDAGRGADRKAVTGPPYHWYWQQSWT
ncbi:hypothetical protein [Brevundimonas sp. Leaf363]|uniref:hypothetical protein n=1 Tax=Brevundimonas sp. Leaf363 TaxID=1736353 RepID=UPI0012E103FE|nr:hypothetical protein [Brevundimonas sp. Leaf363]